MLHKSIHRIRYDEVMGRTVWFCFLSISEVVANASGARFPQKNSDCRDETLTDMTYLDERNPDHGFIGFL